ncbi:polyprenol monophosphomannose synthase [Lignipirellula cremea]|uniref:polyprenol monophosphomannose synthase n=1 Tax=Lignipirellula cremea TaxID=2528010 RepID=UPI001E4AA3B9|nr:polyprenol monophosphomannose synthase [Lignipirellula cremea]
MSNLSKDTSISAPTEKSKVVTRSAPLGETGSGRVLVAIATYNEIENLPQIVDEIYSHCPHVDILVIDDNSPDGTGDWCDERLVEDRRFHCIHRPGKQGLGSATFAGMRFALENGYEYVATMDADFSHSPRFLPDLLACVREGVDPADVAIGSRYVAGGGVQGWPLKRRIMSRLINLYARVMLGLQVRDCSGAFRCYRTSVLRELDFSDMQSQGYSYLEEILWRLKRQDVRFAETPILFVDRIAGQTKINLREAFSAVWIIFQLGLKNWTGLGRK